jgi:plastocyanin
MLRVLPIAFARRHAAVFLAAAALLCALALLSHTGFATQGAVTIDNFTFGPDTLTVPVGTKVTWANHDDIPHTVVSADEVRLFKSPPLDSDDKFSFTFDKAGIYKYFCSIHPKMTGTVIVQ